MHVEAWRKSSTFEGVARARAAWKALSNKNTNNLRSGNQSKSLLTLSVTPEKAAEWKWPISEYRLGQLLNPYNGAGPESIHPGDDAPLWARDKVPFWLLCIWIGRRTRSDGAPRQMCHSSQRWTRERWEASMNSKTGGTRSPCRGDARCMWLLFGKNGL